VQIWRGRQEARTGSHLHSKGVENSVKGGRKQPFLSQILAFSCMSPSVCEWRLCKWKVRYLASWNETSGGERISVESIPENTKYYSRQWLLQALPQLNLGYPNP
jgi:hypothetical protein